jgi:hypothetical protein
MALMPTDLDAATFLVAVLALLVSVGAVLYNRRGTHAAERSAKASEQSAEAASRSAEAASRSAAVAEREERRQLEEAALRAVRWEVLRVGSAVLSLVNRGDGNAYNVRVEVAEGMQVVGAGPVVTRELIRSGESLRVPASTGGYGMHRELQVWWRTVPDGPEQSQRFEL